jgi:probable F420-dependent oxidoreductase
VQLDLMVVGETTREVQTLAHRAHEAGLDGVAVTDTGRPSLLRCLAAGLSAPLHVSSSVALAFPLSPMLTAQMAWELADVTQGRFRLGLGTQVEAHVVRRYGMPYGRPGPRMRDYVGALRAIFAAFRGDRLSYTSEHYRLDLLPDDWNPGPLGHADPPIDVAAVNPWMLTMAASVADGIHLHPLNNPAYLERVLVPSISDGAERVGRSFTDVHLTVPFMGAGGSPEERRAAREFARRKIAFYGSTPNYASIFDDLGRTGLTGRLGSLLRRGDLAGMRDAIDDELLSVFLVEGTWDELPDRLEERYAMYAHRLVLYPPSDAGWRDPDLVHQWGEVATKLRRGEVAGREPG